LKSRLEIITDELDAGLRGLTFSAPVTHVYNPLEYARAPYDRYLTEYARGPKRYVLVGMNPGPWGMMQTGVPFGEIGAARDWLGLEAAVDQPPNQHPKRPVSGFACSRSEVSGRRVWGWAIERFGAPEAFFEEWVIVNHCPLLFFDEAGRNLTPDKLRKADREPLLSVCDGALRDTIAYFEPDFVIGFGRYAERRIATTVGDMGVTCGGVLHPSPASPAANRGWVPQFETQLREMGVPL